MFDNNLYKLGSLCARNHDYESTNMSLRYKSDGHCFECNRTLEKKKYSHDFHSKHDKKPEVKKRRNEYQNKQIKNPMFKINKAMRTSIGVSLKGNKNFEHWIDLVKYTLEELIQHLEKQFTDIPNKYTGEKMSWYNYGRGNNCWNIDHIKPQSWFIFDSIKDEEFIQCWSLNNLQPMWCYENISKNNYYEGKYKEK